MTTLQLTISFVLLLSRSWGPWDRSYFTGLPATGIASEIPPNGVDDLYIAIIVGDIDGPGGTFAEAIQTRTRNAAGRQEVIAGRIRLDPEDIQNAFDSGIFEDLLVHEIGHVLGLGLLWNNNLNGTNYIGTNGLQAWRDIGCTGNLPLQSASDKNHWNEACLHSEIMTPLLQFNRKNRLSNITMGALEDLGLPVNRAEADPFGLDNLGNCGSFCPAAGRRRRRQRRLGEKDGTDDAAPRKLSDKAEEDLLRAAADHFRRLEREEEDEESHSQHHHSVSYLRMENDQFFSRVIHRSQVEHLL